MHMSKNLNSLTALVNIAFIDLFSNFLIVTLLEADFIAV